MMLKGATGAIICTRKSRTSAFGTVARTEKAPGTRPGAAADRKSRPPHTRGSNAGKG